jgi:hypothetical protein
MSDDQTAPGDDRPAPDDDVGPGGDAEEGPDDAPDVPADAEDGPDDAPDVPADADGGAGAPGGADDGDVPESAPDATASTGEGDVTVGDDGGTDGEDEREGPAEADADEAAADGPPTDGEGGDAEDVPEDVDESADSSARQAVPDDVRKYERFTKVDGAQYDRVNDFLRERTYVTAREWAIARLCADFRTETGVEMTKIGENLDELVPFMEDTYSPQAVNQARSSFEEKVHQAGATFLYGAMSDFFTAEELDELMYEVTEVAKFLLEVEGVDLSVEEELEAEDRISGVMREVREASEELCYEECPHCGEQLHD